MIVRGKVSYVVSPLVLDADIRLPFGIHIDRRLWLSSVPPIAEPDSKKAEHCAVVVLGGKRIFADIPDDVNIGRTMAIVYREVDDDALAKFDERCRVKLNHDGKTMDVICINSYFIQLAEKGYPIDDVRARLINSREAVKGA